MPNGWKEMVKDKERRPQSQSISTELRVKDGDIAKVRFITDRSDIFWGYFHSVPKFTRTGERYSESVYCLAEDGLDCPYDGIEGDMSITRRKIYFWIYVYYVLHKQQKKNGTNWESVEFEEEQMFKETVEAPRILGTGPGMNGYIEDRFDTWFKKYKTFLDRDYLWRRKGSGMKDTLYDLVPEDKSDFDMALVKVELPDLESIIKKISVPKEEEKTETKKDKSFVESVKDIFEEEDEE